MNFDKMKAIATALGWDFFASWEVETYYITYAVGNKASTIEISPNHDHGLIVFAAVAKVAMKRRGWWFRVEGEGCRYSDLKHSVTLVKMQATRLNSDTIPYDGECTISEANALIDAIYAALEMETTT